MAVSERRRFNSSERVAAFLSSGGRCENCGVVLEPGWHADHVRPYSKGGPTDAVNAAALCPTCNMKKGVRTAVEDRSWQEKAMGVALGPKTSVLIEAAPATGKTRLGLRVAAERRQSGQVRRVVWVTTGDDLKTQVRNAAAEFGIDLTATFKNGDGRWSSEFDGAVITYSQIAWQPDLWRQRISEVPTILVVDEVHHCADAEDKRWGPALVEAGEVASYRLLLSGTPFRSDGYRIPWVQYIEGQASPDYEYGYRDAVADGVVRPVTFHVYDCEVAWLDESGSEQRMRLADVTKDDEAKALNTALDPDLEWVRRAIEAQDRKLSFIREREPHAGGLIITYRNSFADRLAPVVRRITGEDPVVVHGDSDDPGGIERFRSGNQRWLIAVKMVTEGVDIPRLAVGVYATNLKTDMHLRQMVGRTTRTLSAKDDLTASWAIPSLPTIKALAERLEQQADAGLREDDERSKREYDLTERQLAMWEPLSADDTRRMETIHRGDVFENDVISWAEALMQENDISGEDPAKVCRMLLAAGARPPGAEVGRAMISSPTPVKEDRMRALRRLLNKRVNGIATAEGIEYAHVWFALNKAVDGLKVGQADLSGLEKRVAITAGDDWSWLI